MPTIVSGLDPNVRMNAYLAGQKFQTQIQEQQAEEQREARRQQVEVYKAILEHHKERAKALADMNARAQMGEVIALQQQNMEAAAARKPMSQQRLEGLAEIGSRTTDPEARALLQREGEAMLAEMDKEDQKKASMDVINAGAGDGLIDPELAQQRLASGEEPETIAKEIKAARDKRDEEELNAQESAEAMEYAKHTLAGLPVGSAPARRVAKILQKFSGAQTAQRQKGAGRAFRDQILKAAAFQGEAEQTAESERLASKDIPPAAFPAGGTHATLRGLDAFGNPRQPQGQGLFAGGPIGYSASLPPGQEIMDLFHSSKTSDDFAKALNAAGIQKTPENKQFISKLLQELAGGAAGQ